MSPHSPHFVTWVEALWQRHTSRLTFQEIRRSLTALSRIYTQERARLGTGAALDGHGKRAAFALYYAPMHYVLVDHALQQAGLTVANPPPGPIVDVGCGTGVGAAAWAQHRAHGGQETQILGVDVNVWALGEARWNWQQLGLRGEARRTALADRGVSALTPASSYVLAYVVNELPQELRAALLKSLLSAHTLRGAAVLIVEPISRTLSPWWPTWRKAFVDAGGQEQLLRCRPRLPERMRLLGRAAGLDHQELTARSLSLAWGPPRG